MRIVDLLKKEAVVLNADVSEKEQMLDLLVDLHKKVGNIEDKEAFKAGIMKRESEGPTAIAEGICIPHSKNDAVIKPGIAAITVPGGVDCEALDGEPSNLFFMIAAPAEGSDVHLEALSRLSTILMDPAFREKLLSAKDVEAFLAAIDEKETEKYGEEDKAAQVEEVAAKVPAKKSGYQVLAVTACPTGIAHTYMAAEALEEKGKELGISIKVETNGSEGIKNRLTAEDIARADGVIVAADKKVEMNRFDGKKLVNRPVSDGIRKTEELINLAISGEAPTFHGSDSAASDQEDSAEGSIGSRIYKDLMNGVSHMLPFVIGGGIAIALSFMIDQFIGVPQDQLANLGNYNDVASWFNQIGGAAFGFMLPVLAGFIASSIGDRPGLVAGFAAGALANAGGAGFLGALIGGFLAGYVVVLLRKVFKGLPKSLDGIKTILFYPVFGLIITGLLMLVINIPMKAINDALNHFLLGLDGTNAALLGALLAGMMAIDLGGPVNKAAYVFGTATLASTVAEGGSVVMASVMAGGMVPPLAIFVATRLFKNKFTKDQQDAGLTNIVMGLSFVTEGAIPFAAADPLRVIPSFVVGSAFTGALVGAFGIKLLAPHGGIFVVFLLSNPLLYLLFILIGAIISGIVYGLLKKPVEVPA